MFELLLIALIILSAVLYWRLLAVEKQYTDLKMHFNLKVEDRAGALFEEWRSRELAAQRSVIEEGLRKEFEARLKEGLLKREEEIRRDAVERSRSIIMGRIGEQLAPILIFEKHGINPKDARFIGTQVDHVVFKGLSEGEDHVSEIVFVEVKTGRSASLSPAERKIKRLVSEKKVSWLEINLLEELEKSIGKTRS